VPRIYIPASDLRYLGAMPVLARVYMIKV